MGDGTLTRKGSHLSLLSRQDTGAKAAPETSTDTTNAVGQVEKMKIRDQPERRGSVFSPARPNPLSIGGRKISPVHTYSGNDPGVLRLLDSLYLESYPVDLIEFGRIVPPARGEPVRRGGSNLPNGLWRPEGTLVGMLCEHTAAINRVVAAPDHKFFITGSDDGTVKIWDTSRLERNVSHRSRFTHSHGSKVQVTNLAFVENTHCFVSTGSDGSIHVVKVDCTEENKVHRYGKLSLMREYQLPEGVFAVWCEHHQVDNHSILVVATNTCKVLGIELRGMTVLYELQNPLHHGTPTSFCVDKRNHWLLLGTSHGVLDLWDLRFKIKLRSWGFPGGVPIHRLISSQMRGIKRSRVTIAGGSPHCIMVFDLERGTIKEVYRSNSTLPESSTGTEASRILQAQLPTLVDLDEEQNAPGGVLSRFASSSTMEGTIASTTQAVRGIAVGTHFQDDDEPRYAFMISGGPDWKVRFWDSSRAEMCMVISGMEVDESKPKYTWHTVGDVVVVSETSAAVATTNSSANTAAAAAAGNNDVGVGASGSDRKSGNAAGVSKKKTSKASIVAMQQQNLLRGHKDTVLDVALLEIPYGMVVSVDRGGVIYVHS